MVVYSSRMVKEGHVGVLRAVSASGAEEVLQRKDEGTISSIPLFDL